MKTGAVISFYSYKGGVGRSFALSNIAAVLSNWNFRVLCIDWDLDAPGLNYYFKPSKLFSGLVEMITDFKIDNNVDWRNYVTPISLDKNISVDVIFSGGEKLKEKIQQLQWANLYEEEKLAERLELWREEWQKEYDFILIDSRTGITDIGAICTVFFPDILLFFFTANYQSLNGAVETINSVLESRNFLPFDRSVLLTVPVPSRFDSREEYKRAEKWRELFNEKLSSFCIPWCNKDVDVHKILDRITIPYVPYWSFGEELPVIVEKTRSSDSISLYLETLAALIAQKLNNTDILSKSVDQYIEISKINGKKRNLTFLSYAHDDLDQVQKVYEGLRERQVNIWFDNEDLVPGEWKPQIKKTIKKSRYVVFCLSETSVGREAGGITGFLDKEIQLSLEIAKEQPEDQFTIIPVKLADNILIDHRLSTLKQYDLSKNFEKGLDKLAVALGGVSVSDVLIKEVSLEDEKLIEIIMDKADSLNSSGKFKKALSMYNDAIEIKPDLHEAWLNKGCALDNLGKYKEAVEAFEKVIEIKPNLQEAWLNKGRALYNSGKYEEAISAYDKAIAIKPDDHDAWFNKGLALYELGEFKEAITAFDIVIAIKPDNHDVWTIKGIVLGKSNKYKEAISAYDKAIEIKPDDHDAWFNKGLVLKKLGRDIEAEKVFQRTKKLKKVLDFGWWNKYRHLVLYIGTLGALTSIITLFIVFWSHQQSQEATTSFNERLSSFESTIKSKIDDPAAVQKAKEEYEKKLADMEKTIKNLKTGDKKARDEALKALREGDYSKARKLFEEIRKKEKEKDKELAKASYNQGEIAFMELDFEGALSHYLDSERLDIDNTLYLKEIGKIYYTIGKYKKAIEYYDKALTIDIKTYGTEHPKIAVIWNNLGETWRALGQYKKALEYYKKALSTNFKNYGKDHTQVALNWNNLGEVCIDLGQYEKAIQYFEKALSTNLKTYGKDHPNVATYWNNLGSAYHSLGKYDKAIEFFEKALSSDLKTYGPQHPNVATRWNNLGLVYRSLGKYEKAIEFYDKALNSDLKTYGPQHPAVARVWNNLGSAYHSLGKYDKAIEFFEKALSSDLKTYGPQHPAVARVWNNLGRAYHSLGKYEKAIEFYDKALNSDLKTYGPQHPNVATRWNNLGLVYRSLDQYDKAIEYFEKVLSSDLKTYGPEHPDVARDRNNLGLAYHSLGKYDKAIEYFEKALSSDLKTYGPQHPDVARDRNNLGFAYHSLDKYDKAIEYFEKALKIFEASLGKDHPDTKKARKNLEFTRKNLK